MTPLGVITVLCVVLSLAALILVGGQHGPKKPIGPIVKARTDSIRVVTTE